MHVVETQGDIYARRVRGRLTDLAPGNAFGEPTAASHSAIYADAVADILLEAGIDKVTMGAVARRLRQAPSAVTQMTQGKQGFLSAVVGRFAGRWARWAAQPEYTGQVRVRLPESEVEVHGVRVWSALREVAAGEARAGDPSLAAMVGQADDQERLMLAAALRGRGIDVPDSFVTALKCLGDGLRMAIADPTAPLDPQDARAIATLVTERLCGPEATAVPTLPDANDGQWRPPNRRRPASRPGAERPGAERPDTE